MTAPGVCALECWSQPSRATSALSRLASRHRGDILVPSARVWFWTDAGCRQSGYGSPRRTYPFQDLSPFTAKLTTVPIGVSRGTSRRDDVRLWLASVSGTCLKLVGPRAIFAGPRRQFKMPGSRSLLAGRESVRLAARLDAEPRRDAQPGAVCAASLSRTDGLDG